MLDEIFDNLKYNHDANCLAKAVLKNEKMYQFLLATLDGSQGLTIDRFSYWDTMRHEIIYGITLHEGRPTLFFHDIDKEEWDFHNYLLANNDVDNFNRYPTIHQLKDFLQMAVDYPDEHLIAVGGR